jgi:hypothetical protein
MTVNWPSGTIEEHLFDLKDFLALFLLQKMRRLGPDDAENDAFRGQDAHPLAEGNVAPPAAQRKELDVAVISNLLDHEANFVHVADDQNPGLVGRAGLAPHNRPEFVVEDFVGNPLHFARHDRADFFLVTRRTIGLGDFLQQKFCLVHAHTHLGLFA